MARVLEINLFPYKKAPKTSVLAAELIAGGGIVGDVHADDKERAVSLMGQETLLNMELERGHGLCTNKFAANLITQGLDYSSLRPGDVLSLGGGGAAVRIAQVGKECFAECKLEDRAACCLRGGCAFGVAESAGIIKTMAEIALV